MLAAACADAVHLPEVPVTGGSPAARAAIRDELAAFDGAVGPGDVRLTEVAVRPLPDLLGLYQEARRRISLHDGLPDDQVARILRHELCHALEHQHGVVDDPVPVLDAFGAWLYAPEGADLPDRPSARGRRAEALAELCEMGPLRAWALTLPCPKDPPRAEPAYGWVDANVWRAWDRPEVHPLGEPVASWVADRPFATATVTATDAPGRLGIVLRHADGAVELHGAELWTGAPAAPGEALGPPAAPEGSGAVWGLDGGPLLSVVAFPGLRRWFEVPAEPRLVLDDGEDHTLVAGACLRSVVAWNVFYLESRFWYAWADGATVSWAPLP